MIYRVCLWHGGVCTFKPSIIRPLELHASQNRFDRNAALPRESLCCAVWVRCWTVSAWEKKASFPNAHRYTHDRTRRSIISKTNITIGFDTLLESDTRGEERAYRGSVWVQRLSQAWSVSCWAEKGRIPLLPSSSLTLNAHRVILTGHKETGVHTFLPPPPPPPPLPPTAPPAYFSLLPISLLPSACLSLSGWMGKKRKKKLFLFWVPVKWFLMTHCSRPHNMYFRVNESGSTWSH